MQAPALPDSPFCHPPGLRALPPSCASCETPIPEPQAAGPLGCAAPAPRIRACSQVPHGRCTQLCRPEPAWAGQGTGVPGHGLSHGHRCHLQPALRPGYGSSASPGAAREQLRRAQAVPRRARYRPIPGGGGRGREAKALPRQDNGSPEPPRSKAPAGAIIQRKANSSCPGVCNVCPERGGRAAPTPRRMGTVPPVARLAPLPWRGWHET